MRLIFKYLANLIDNLREMYKHNKNGIDPGLSLKNNQKASTSSKLRERKNNQIQNNNTIENYDHYFDNLNCISTPASIEAIIDNTLKVNPVKSKNFLDQSEFFSIISEMRATIKYLTEKVNNLSTEIRQSQNKSFLNIGTGEVKENDMHHLKKFEVYTLPIDNLDDLEKLEMDLKNDKSFNVFFVRINRKIFFFIFSTF